MLRRCDIVYLLMLFVVFQKKRKKNGANSGVCAQEYAVVILFPQEYAVVILFPSLSTHWQEQRIRLHKGRNFIRDKDKPGEHPHPYWLLFKMIV